MRRTTLIILSVLVLIIGSSMSRNADQNTKQIHQINKYIGSDVNVLKVFRTKYIVKEVIKPIPNKPKEETTFKVSAYDLSYQSTQKSRGSKGYGITSSGFSLRGHTLLSAMTIATDPSVIPIGSKVRLTFKDNKYKKYDNVYIARDVGGGIKNNEIDLFMGDFGSSKANRATINFGIAEASVTIIEN